MKQLRCQQHELPFSLFCDRCDEPVCDQCSVVGPHNSSIHSLSQLPQAYERRVQEIKERLHSIYTHRDQMIGEIIKLNQEIQDIKLRKQTIATQNNKYQSKMLQKLVKAYENVYSGITKSKEDLFQQFSKINDLGHEFEGMEDEIECIVSYGKIIKQFKEVSDRTQLLLEKPIKFQQLPRELTDIRVQLDRIGSLQKLVEKKKEIIKSLISNLHTEKAKIKSPTLNYNALLADLQLAMKSNNSHYVCHFCGQPLSQQSMNTMCEQNKIHEDITLCDIKYKGYCEEGPDSTKFATHRHFFDRAKDPFRGFRQAFFSQDKNTYLVYLNGLLLKLKTLMKIKSKTIKDIFQKSDKEKVGECELIVFKFALIETCRLTEPQTEILCRVFETKDSRYNYKILLDQLQKIEI